MSTVTDASLMSHFSTITDPRVNRRKLHELADIIAIAILAVICDADNWSEVELFGQSKQKWLKELLSLPNGIPSHDTFGRVFARLDPLEFQACFNLGQGGEHRHPGRGRGHRRQDLARLF